MKKQKLYKDVVPNPDFAAIEKEVLAHWQQHNIFQKSIDNRSWFGNE